MRPSAAALRARSTARSRSWRHPRRRPMTGRSAVMMQSPKGTWHGGETILKQFGKLFYTGDQPGTAQTAKLANSLMASAALVITSEAVAMGVKGGVNAKVLIDIINASSGRNSASEDKFPRAVLPG